VEKAQVPKTLLAVDDSATMRKVLAITFAGDDFRVVSADGPQSALAHMGDGPVAAVIDAALDGDGYALAKEMRSRDPRLAIVLLTSRYNPYDPGRGRESGADDYADKPFDTQALLDKVKKAMIARETGKAAAAPAPAASAPHAPAPAPAPMPMPPPSAPRMPGPGAPLQRPVLSTQRTHTLSFEGASPAPPPPPIARTAPAGTPVAQPVRPPAAPVTAPAPAPRASVQRDSSDSITTAVPPRPVEGVSGAVTANGQLARKLGELGLSAQQVDAVLALSREVVERVVWEVVPQLAEALIKEEISRLTKE
jgi:CheY-like chemotaxis protein